MQSNANTTDYSVREELRRHSANLSKILAHEKDLVLLSDEEYKNLKNRTEFVEFCIGRLKDEEQETIRLIFFKGMAYRAYQRAKCLSKRGAEKRIQRAVRSFKELMG
jgi:DNA-directed RNA polymerase specialized sigma24 family protein